MIGPEEIKKQALKWWPELLIAAVNGQDYFPKSITRIGKIQPGDILGSYATIQQQLAALLQHAKPNIAKSYVVHLKDYHFQKTGTQRLPDFIEFESLEDYLNFTGKFKEWQAFQIHLPLIENTMPALKDWVLLNAGWLTNPNVHWTAILQVCLYFVGCPRPNLYIRQLPIQVHTKFIEQNAALISSLLDFLLPGDIRNPKEHRVDRRYYLRYDEPLIRINNLDKNQNLLEIKQRSAGHSGQSSHSSQSSFKLSDISIPISDFNHLVLPVNHVLITENKMNFLTLPDLPGAISIWSGGGFQVSSLRDAKWLGTVNIYYWGDIDEHGFQILHQLRSYFPHTKSVMMDVVTLEAFSEHQVTGAKNKAETLSLLTPAEQKCYQLIKSSSLNRLEQEKIDQVYAKNYLLNEIMGRSI